MSATIVASGDASPGLEAAEHVLEAVAGPVDPAVVGVLDLAGLSRWDAGRDALVLESGAVAVAVVPVVGDKDVAAGSALSRKAAPAWSLISPLESSMATGRHWPSQTACSLEFRPPFVRPIWRGKPSACHPNLLRRPRPLARSAPF